MKHYLRVAAIIAVLCTSCGGRMSLQVGHWTCRLVDGSIDRVESELSSIDGVRNLSLIAVDETGERYYNGLYGQSKVFFELVTVEQKTKLYVKSHASSSDVEAVSKLVESQLERSGLPFSETPCGE